MAHLRPVQRAHLNILAWGALLASCGDPTGPAGATVDDLMLEIADTWESSTNIVSVSPGIAFLASPPAAKTCVYNGSSGRFVCPIRTMSGLTFATAFQLFDGGSAPQTSFNPRTTDAIHTFTDVSGSLPGISSDTVTTLTTRDDRVLSGLLSGAHTLNGTGTSTFTTTAGSTSSTTTMVETTTDLVLAVRGGPSPHPTSGSIRTLVYSGIPGAGATRLATVTAYFNGTQKVTVVIEAGGVTHTCTIDLKGVAPAVCT
jgi:hypothetical protein